MERNTFSKLRAEIKKSGNVKAMKAFNQLIETFGIANYQGVDKDLEVCNNYVELLKASNKQKGTKFISINSGANPKKKLCWIEFVDDKTGTSYDVTIKNGKLNFASGYYDENGKYVPGDNKDPLK